MRVRVTGRRWHALIGCYGRHRRSEKDWRCVSHGTCGSGGEASYSLVAKLQSSWLLWPAPQREKGLRTITANTAKVPAISSGQHQSRTPPFFVTRALLLKVTHTLLFSNVYPILIDTGKRCLTCRLCKCKRWAFNEKRACWMLSQWVRLSAITVS